MNSETVRLVVPDSHGCHADSAACNAFLQDLRGLDPREIVMLGDHLDCAGVFSSHSRSYTDEMAESYQKDCAATNSFLDSIQKYAPRARIWYLEGNHEQRVERWAASTFPSESDAKSLLEAFGPEKVLNLKQRGISYFKRSVQYQGLSIPGTIRLGKIFYVHGISHSKHAAATHLARFGANVVHGHTHRAQHIVERTVTSDGFMAACPGTLAKLQPLYCHTAPTGWSHGYGLELIRSTGQFVHINVPIHKGESLLPRKLRRV